VDVIEVTSEQDKQQFLNFTTRGWKTGDVTFFIASFTFSISTELYAVCCMAVG
jgi:hypothetical protein